MENSSSSQLVEQLLQLSEPAEQTAFLETLADELPEDQLTQFAMALRQTSLQFLRTDIQRAQQIGDWLAQLATITGNPRYQALSYWVEGHARSIGLGEIQPAMACYLRAAEIFEALGEPLLKTRLQINVVWPLTASGQPEEALRVGEEAGQVLAAHEEYRSLAGLYVNLSVAHGRLGQDQAALALLDKASRLYHQVSGPDEPNLALVTENQAIFLRRLGRLKESMAANEQALALMEKAGFTVEMARVYQSQARTYMLLGRYTDALAILDKARELFAGDGRQRDVMLLELYISDCLLQLRRFPDVLEKCQAVRRHFQKLEADFEGGQAILNEAIAAAGLGQTERAFQSLAEARAIFAGLGSDVWVANTDLETAVLLRQEGRYEESLARAEAAERVYAQGDLRIKQAYAQLAAAHTAVEMGRLAQAEQQIAAALAISRENDLPSLTFQARALQGRLAVARRQSGAAIAAYDQAIVELERLRGQLMMEFRAEFLTDKGAVYEEMVQLYLADGQATEALRYVERAKSRALLDLITYRVDLGIRARAPEDEPLVERLTALRAERDRLYHRWHSDDKPDDASGHWSDADRHQLQAEALALEKQITETWHRLLVRNADYAQNAAMWQVQVEDVQPELAGDTAVLEYFVAQGELLLFVVTREAVRVVPLPGAVAQLPRLLNLLRLNNRSVARSPGAQRPYLIQNAQALLTKLYKLLLPPAVPHLAGKKRLIIVPHGLLHYLPFPALYDGERYLVEDFEVSYLPSSSLLRYYRQVDTAVSGMTVLGHSQAGKLPYALEEAAQVAALGRGTLYLEDEATTANLTARAAGKRYIHLAAHGEFRADNALFSGISLADGWLTTLDVFNLRFHASLVTLSACDTGRNVISGGDELLGLMRAFLAAGAAALLLTLWAVDDRSTAVLMADFYRALLAGSGKGAALRRAQCRLIQSAPDQYAHPYFWAPFYLVGETTGN
ncbi:MAG TPA: CHAT domain-containing protein [Anaerolineae bacterium]|nr:CHAT domain-containing protein [Anaerolineae bacterium]